MSLTIRHGANGGYKSSSVVQDYIIPAMEEGRTVVTNIRGVTLKRMYDAGVNVHKSSEIIYVDSDNTPEGKIGRKLLSCWWHWAPFNALICFDESGVLFPKSWRDADIKKLDSVLDSCNEHPIFGDYEIEQGDRPDSFVESFEMHRHYGWDIILSAPNIKSIRDDIRNTTELAWRHRNAALIGLKGRFKAVSHDPSNNGTSASHILESRMGKIKQRTFECYDSTKTGTSKDSANAAHALLGSPRFLMAMAMCACAFFFAFSSGGFDTIGNPTGKNSAAQSVEVGPKENNNNVSRGVSASQNNKLDYFLIFGYEFDRLKIVGRVGETFSFEGADSDGFEYTISQENVADSGFLLIPKSDCHVILYSANFTKSVFCSLPRVLDDEDYEDYLAQEVDYDSNYNSEERQAVL